MTTLTEPRMEFLPVPLAHAPEVQALLKGLGLGSLREHGLKSYGGRNDNWVGVTSSGEEVFVKAMSREEDGTSHQLQRSLSFESLVAGLGPDTALRTPHFLGADPTHALMAYACLTDAESGAEAATRGRFTADHCTAAGRALATLHRLDVPEDVCTDPSELPPLPWLDAVPWEQTLERTSAQIAAWQLLQKDAEVRAALHDLRRLEAVAPQVPIHADLRLDQFLVGADDLHLCDWEEFRRGDAARDVGAFLGEWLFQATYTVFAPDSRARRSSALPPEHPELVQDGGASIRDHLPYVAAFWSGYLELRTVTEPEVARAVAFAGWHMFDRLVATAQSQALLNPIARAAAGVGRQLLLAPAAAVGLLGPSGRTTR